MKYFLILNPGSRSGKSSKAFKKIFDMLDKAKINYDYKLTANMDEAYNRSVTANKAGYDVIVAVGGDGTINKVLNGFYDNNGCRISKAKMGVIYTGTSPDFCKSYNIPYDLDSAVNVLIKNNTVKIKTGKITYATKYMPEFENKPVENNNDFQSGYFGCCANIGIGVSLARYANSGIRKIAGDFWGTLISLLRVLVSYKPNDFLICRDGKQERLKNLCSLSIGKTYYIASGIKVNSDLKNEDSHFYNMAVQNLGLKNISYCLRAIYSGRKIKNNNCISLKYCSTIEIYGNNQNPEVEFDGDPAGFLPCKIEMAKDELNLITGKTNG